MRLTAESCGAMVLIMFLSAAFVIAKLCFPTLWQKMFKEKGIAKEAAWTATRVGFEDAGIEWIIAVVVPENKALWRVLRP
jgi:hypothetical protein